MMWYSLSPRGFGDATPFSAASNRLGALGPCLNTIQCESSCCSWYVPRRYEWVGVGDGQSVQSCALKVWKNWDALSISDLSLYWWHPLLSLNWTNCVYCISCTAFTELSALLEFMEAIASIELNLLMSCTPFIGLNALVAPWCIQVEIFASRCTISMVEA